MTARTGRPLASDGTGRGKKVVTRPITKKRGASKDRTEVVALNRKKYVSASCIPVAEIESTIDPNKPLTEKAKLFVKFWAQGESVQSAAVRAGYGDAASYAYRLVHFPQAKALYAEEKRLYEEAAQMTRIQVMEGLKEAIDMARLVSEPSAMVAGWREIGKMCGYYEPQRKTIDINVRGMEKLNGLSDHELLKMIKEGAEPAILAITHDEEEETDGQAS